MPTEILAPGQCSADGEVMTRVIREGYRVQAPDERWSIDTIMANVRNFFIQRGAGPRRDAPRTDMVFTNGESAISSTNFIGSDERVYCGLTPRAAEETITVWGSRRRRDESPSWEEQLDRSAAWSRDYVLGDMGPNPARPYDFRVGQCSGVNLENDGIALRIPNSGGIAGLSCETVAPSQVGLEFNMGDIVRNLRNRREEEAERRARNGNRD